MSSRREVITLLSGAAAWPFAARACNDPDRLIESGSVPGLARLTVASVHPTLSPARSAQPRRREAAPHRRHGVVYEEISQHRAAQGPADERCHHRVSQGRVPLSQTESAKDSGHYRAWSAAHEFILASNTEISRKRLDDYQHRPAEYVNAGLLLRGMERNFDY